MQKYIFIIVALFIFSCGKDDEGHIQLDILRLESVKWGNENLPQNEILKNAAVDKGIIATFSLELEKTSVEENLKLKDANGNYIALEFNYLNEDRTVTASPLSSLESNEVYTVEIGLIKAITGEEFPGANYSFHTIAGNLNLETVTINGADLTSTQRIQNVPIPFEIEATFNEPLDPQTTFSDYITVDRNGSVPLSFSLSTDQKTLTITPVNEVDYLKEYIVEFSSDLTNEEGFVFEGFTNGFYTSVDSTYKFPEISEESLLTLVQEQTFRYFWDFAHPASGMARERNTSGDLVTTGGSGFGVMTILVGIERGFITRQEGIERIGKIVDFLKVADRFHGVWPHWINGNTGNVIPFSTKDNGGDLVETAFMIQGLLTVREFLNPSVPQEAAIATSITQLWEEVEWDWYTKGGEEVLYWHWSPTYEWEMNHKIQGWNEALIVYVLAAFSPTHPIDATVYHQGWARNGEMSNGNAFYDINLPLGPDYGGPLFFSHYSFLGLDPRNLEDQYANYWTQNKNHALIHHEYAIDNPKNFVGYGAAPFGLTASDNHDGYSAHSPTNDLGVITPTAALSSIPYTPELSTEAMNYFYYLVGDRIWGEYGFYDAYNPTEDWYANSYLAIDQGPIVIMIENHRTGLLWDLFMSNPEIVIGLQKLGFTNY